MAKTAESGGPKLASLKFLVEKVLSTDDEGTVMRISDRGSVGKPYALKKIRRESPDHDGRLAAARASVEASPELGHPAILAYHDYRTLKSWFRPSGGELLMDFVDGVSLDKLESIEIGQGILIFRQLAAALAHMHRRGVHHGDLKPSHVIVSKSGQIKTFGYGLSKVKPSGKPRGSKLFMAPEQMRGDVVDEKTDLYNLGATMYQVLTGQPANVGRRSEGEGGKIPIPTALNPKIPASLNNLIVGCLQSQPAKRPESAHDVLAKLETTVKEMHLDDGTLRKLARVGAAEDDD